MWPEAADTGCPLYVRFREAKRTRFARCEFRDGPGFARLFRTVAGVRIGVCVPCAKRFWRPTVPKDNGIGPKPLLRLGTPVPPGSVLEAPTIPHPPDAPWSGLPPSNAVLRGLENCWGSTCTVLPTTADGRRFSRVSLRRSATLKRLPPFRSWLPSIGRWRMRASANAPLNSESRSCPRKTGRLRRADRGRLLGSPLEWAAVTQRDSWI